MMVACCRWASGESNGLLRQLNSQGSVKKLMFTTSIPWSAAYV